MTHYPVAVPPDQIAKLILEAFGRNGLKFAAVHSWPFLNAAFLSDLDLAIAESPEPALRHALVELAASPELRVVQSLHYEIVSGYYVIVATREQIPRFFHFDCLFDPLGVNRYCFRTTFLASNPQLADAAPAVSPDRLAAYTTVKRAMKASLSEVQWRALRGLLDGRIETVSAILHSELRLRATDTLQALMQARNATEAQSRLVEIHRGLKRTKWSRFPVRTALGVFLSVWRQAGRLVRPTGFFVVLAGPDGCGKSTIAKRLPELCARGFRRTLHFHWRPGLLPKLRRKSDAAGSGGAPPASARGNQLVSVARLLYYASDFVLGYWLQLAPLRARTTLVVGERYFADVLVHPQRYGFNVPRWFLRAVSYVVPRPDLTILLTNDPDVIHARKPELTVSQIEAQLTQYREELPNWGRFRTVETRRSAEEVASEVADIVLSQVADRTMARIVVTHV